MNIRVVAMIENIGVADRMVRFIVAIVFIIIGFVVSPWWFIVAGLALITGILGWCGLYSLLGISTCKDSCKVITNSSSKKNNVVKKPTKKSLRKKK
jgi:hypothetical protein